MPYSCPVISYDFPMIKNRLDFHQQYLGTQSFSRLLEIPGTGAKEHSGNIIGKTMWLFVFSCVFNVISGFYGVLIIPKWLINDS